MNSLRYYAHVHSRCQNPDVQDLSALHRTDICQGECQYCNSLAFSRHELDFQRGTIRVAMYDRTYIASGQPVLREIAGQYDCIMFIVRCHGWLG